MATPIEQIASSDFPLSLREIADPPKSLYIQGKLPESEYTYLAVVGSRRMSAYGRRVCEQLVGGLVGQQVCIVSGLALGIDSIAHETALSAHLPTIAVLPSGLDPIAIYPAAHRSLAKRIVENDGALISEYKPEDKPKQWSFAARNRIVAGLCRATLVIEAPERSGALITARLALEYNREVLAVPHPLGSETGAGTNSLLRRGATLVRNSNDILESLGIDTEVQNVQTPKDLSPDEQTVYDCLSESPERGDLPQLSGLSAQRINVAVSMLVIKGIAREEMGKIIRA